MFFRSSHLSRKPARRLGLEALEDRCLLNAGALDPTFGNGAGYVSTSTSAYSDYAHNVLIQPNGDIVAIGSADTATGSELAVERYNLDGSLDTSFGSGGIALTSFGSGSARGTGAALYPAGTANAGDIVQEGSYNQSQVLVRYNNNGTLDPTFGTGGEVMTAFPGMTTNNRGCGVVVTSAGQIVAYSGDNTLGDFVLTRYNADGSLDTTFGQGGSVITTVPDGANASGAPTLLQQPDGKLIVTQAQSNGVWDLYRFNADGTLDTSFGNQGIVATTVPIASTLEYAVLYPNAGTPNDGQIVVSGMNGAGGEGTWEFARYNPNGSLDTTFGTGGLVQTQVLTESDGNENMTLDANGRIVVAGENPGSAGVNMELARFNVNGTPDTTFGNGGLVIMPTNYNTQGNGVAIYPNAGTAEDGDIVAVGQIQTWTNDSAKADVLVARFLGQPSSPYFTITGPSSIAAGAAGSYTVTADNPNGTIDTGYSGTVQITSSDSKAVLPGNLAITNGTGAFNVTLETASTQSITATDVNNPSMTGFESGITVSPGAASQVIFTEQPARSTAGVTLGTVEVTLEDAYGNVETGDNSDKVTLSVNSGPSTQLGGTLTETVAAGNALFSNLLLDTSGSYTLAALATLSGGGTLGPVVSSGFTVASPVSLYFGNITYNSRTKLYSETVTLTNTTSGTLTGPMSLELTNLPSGVVLTDATGTTNGNPYYRFLASGKTLKKGASTSITLTFTAASLSDITFGTEVVVGL